MVRAVCCFALLLSLITAVLAEPTEAATHKYVIDLSPGSYILKDEEEQDLLLRSQELSEKWQMDFVVLVVADAKGKDSKSYADEYYDTYGYGDDGILYMLDLDNEGWWISSCGLMMDYLPTERLNAILRVGREKSDEGGFASGFMAMMDETDQYLDMDINGGTSETENGRTDDGYVADMAMLLESDERELLDARLKDLSEKWGMDFIVVTTAQTNRKDSAEYADDYYEQNDYAKDSVLYLMDMDNGVVYISTYGAAAGYLPDSKLDEILDAGYDNAEKGNYYKGLEEMLDQTENCLASGKNTGKQVTIWEILIAIAGALLGGFVVRRPKKEKREVYAYPYKEKARVEFTQKEDREAGQSLVLLQKKKTKKPVLETLLDESNAVSRRDDQSSHNDDRDFYYDKYGRRVYYDRYAPRGYFDHDRRDRFWPEADETDHPLTSGKESQRTHPSAAIPKGHSGDGSSRNLSDGARSSSSRNLSDGARSSSSRSLSDGARSGGSRSLSDDARNGSARSSGGSGSKGGNRSSRRHGGTGQSLK